MVSTFRSTTVAFFVTFLFVSSCQKNFFGQSSESDNEISGATEESSCPTEFTPPPLSLSLADEAVTSLNGTLQFGNSVLQDMHTELLVTNTPAVSTAIVNAAQNEMQTVIGTLAVENYDATKNLDLVTPPITKGAFFSLTSGCASADTYELRSEVAKDIVTAVSVSIKSNAGETKEEDIIKVMGNLTSSAVKTLPDLKMLGENAASSISMVTESVVGALPKAGIEENSITKAAQSVVSGSVSALESPGYSKDSIGLLASASAASAVVGLSAAGLSTQKILEDDGIGKILSTVLTELKLSSAGSSGAIAALQDVAKATISVLMTSGFDTPESRRSAMASVVGTLITEAGALSEGNSDVLSEAMATVANESVQALTAGGFELDEISDAVKVIVKTGVAKIADLGITNAATATALAEKLVSGTINGTAALKKSDNLSTKQIESMANAASAGAVAGLEVLQNAGTVSGSDVNKFTTAVTKTITSNLKSSGVSQGVVVKEAVAEVLHPEVAEEVVVEEEEVVVLETVVAPSFSVATGTYTSTISVSITTPTTGAAIRYTIDGSNPTATTGNLYTTAISIGASKTVKAIAYKTGWNNSSVSSVVYTMNIPTFGTASYAATGNGPEGIAVGDMNADGKMDLAVALYSGQGVSFLLGNGDGTFATKQDYSNIGNGTNINSSLIAMADFNADSKPDAVWGAWGNNFISTLTNTTAANASTLTFSGAPWGNNTGVSGPRGVAIADMDNDGDQDIAVGEANGHRLIVYQNDDSTPGNFTKFGSNWTFNDAVAFSGHAHPAMIALADFNNDGLMDVAGGGYFAGRFSVILNTNTVAGAPSFNVANGFDTNIAYGCNNNAQISLNDFNGDGKMDYSAICPTGGDDKVIVYMNTTATNATTATFIGSSFVTSEGIAAIATGDVNGDGKKDIVAVSSSGGSDVLELFLGQGDGTFSSAENFVISTGKAPQMAVLKDINGDSKLDVVVTNYSGNDVSILLNQLGD